MEINGVSLEFSQVGQRHNVQNFTFGVLSKKEDWCLVGNEGMDPKESLLGLIPSFPTKHQSENGPFRNC